MVTKIEPQRSVTLMLKNKRIGFPDLAKPRSIQGGKPVYGVRVILEPGDADIKVIEAAMLEVATWKWKESAADILDVCVEKGRTCLSKKPYRNKEGKVYTGFEGKFSLGASAPEDKTPSYFDEFGVQILGVSDVERKLYSGCRANLKVEIYPLPRDDGNRISCAILGVMFAAHDEAFGGGTGPATASDFAGMANAHPDAESVL